MVVQCWGDFVASHRAFQVALALAGELETIVSLLKNKTLVDTLGIEPRAFRMRSGCDATTPCAPYLQGRKHSIRKSRALAIEAEQ